MRRCRDRQPPSGSRVRRPRHDRLPRCPPRPSRSRRRLQLQPEAGIQLPRVLYKVVTRDPAAAQGPPPTSSSEARDGDKVVLDFTARCVALTGNGDGFEGVTDFSGTNSVPPWPSDTTSARQSRSIDRVAYMSDGLNPRAARDAIARAMPSRAVPYEGRRGAQRRLPAACRDPRRGGYFTRSSTTPKGRRCTDGR